jgi:glycosyltransferase involved in cell wall biosynthesis
VRFLGMQRDMRELYAIMDIFVLPSYREGFPRSAMEAASMGLPLVLSNIRGCREVLEDGVNGFMVPPHDPIALEKAIASLVQRHDLRQSMGHASRARAVKEFDERVIIRKTLRVYETVMALRHHTSE